MVRSFLNGLVVSKWFGRFTLNRSDKTQPPEFFFFNCRAADRNFSGPISCWPCTVQLTTPAPACLPWWANRILSISARLFAQQLGDKSNLPDKPVFALQNGVRGKTGVPVSVYRPSKHVWNTRQLEARLKYTAARSTFGTHDTGGVYALYSSQPVFTKTGRQTCRKHENTTRSVI